MYLLAINHPCSAKMGRRSCQLLQESLRQATWSTSQGNKCPKNDQISFIATIITFVSTFFHNQDDILFKYDCLLPPLIFLKLFPLWSFSDMDEGAEEMQTLMRNLEIILLKQWSIQWSIHGLNKVSFPATQTSVTLVSLTSTISHQTTMGKSKHQKLSWLLHKCSWWTHYLA